MNYKGIFFYLGLYSIAVSILSLLNILYSVYLNFNLSLNSYFASLLLSLFFGLSLCFYGRDGKKNISATEQIILIILTFFFIPLLISIPYLLSGYNINFLNSYFESVSGFTTTGYSIFTNIEKIDEPLLLWRSSSQWLGGFIFLIFAIGTLGSKYVKIKPSYLLSETNLLSNFYNNFSYNFIKVFLIYFFSTILIISFYTFSNIRLLDSFNLAFTVISSGGFLSKNNLTDIILNNYQNFVVSISMLFPIVNFYIFFKILTKRFEVKNHYEDLHLVFLVFFLVLFLNFFILPDANIFMILQSIVSSLSTSGITTLNTNFDLSIFFILLSIIGGSLLSSSSGLKYVRFYILLKISHSEIYRLVKPINVYNKNLFNSESKISFDDAKIVFLVFITFIISIFILSSILTFENLSFENSFKLSILTLTNTVPSALHGMEDVIFADKNIFTKSSLIVFMILGRIEIIAVLFSIKKFILKS